jgi:predicted ATPase/DNA-binding SARP family transcriptional activator
MENEVKEIKELKIYTLGDFRILWGGEPVTSLRSRKAQALLVYLASTNQAHAREVLAELFWGDSSQSRAMSNLRDVIHTLRKHLEPVIDVTRYTIGLNPKSDVWIDAAEVNSAFEITQKEGDALTAGKARQIEKALRLYEQDFLEGFFLRGARGFEEWLVVERERIRMATLDSLLVLVRHFEREANFKKGIYYARQALELEPLMEVSHQLLMRLLALSGRRSEALIQYRNCQQVLQKELGTEPSEETRDLYERLLRGESLPGVSVRKSKHNLQIPFPSLIGRGMELGKVSKQLEDPDCKLVTLLGVGGIGKTSLGLHVAEKMIAVFPDGVWLVELASFFEPEMVPDKIAAVFGVTAQEARGGLEVTEILINFLRDKSLLLVLDNCEHLIEACASFSSKLLNGCPSVKILATSRETLGLREERPFQVAPLSFPPLESPPKRIVDYPAIQLFVERASHAQPSFHLTAENIPEITEICRELEGIPLAIELAAARARVISLDQIAKRLQDRFRLLTGGPRISLPRHQTLQATMDWSYELLTDLEQSQLRRLAVFSGGWTLKAAEEVVSFGEVDQNAVLDLLSNLVDKSLVLVKDQGTRMRYRMLETVRQYGLRMLSEKGEFEKTRHRHANFFVQLAEQTDEGLRDSRQVEAMEILDTEHDNLRGALRWAIESRNPDLALRLVGALGWFWLMRGHWKESGLWFKKALDLGNTANPSIRAKAICRAGELEVFRGNVVGLPDLFEEALEIYQQEGDQEGLAWVYTLIGQTKLWTDTEPDQAIDYISKGIELFDHLGIDWGIAFALKYLGMLIEYDGEYERGMNLQKEGISIFERIGDSWNEAHSLFLLGRSAARNNDLKLADWASEQCLRKSSLIEDKVMVAHALRGLSQSALQKNDSEHMEEIHIEALEALQKIGDEYCIGLVLRGLGEVKQRKGDFTKAYQFLKQSLLTFEKLGLDDLMVLVIDRFAHLAIAAGNRKRAVRLLGATKELDEGPGKLKSPQYREERENLYSSIREVVGDREFGKLYEEGAEMSFEDAVSYVLRDTAED